MIVPFGAEKPVIDPTAWIADQAVCIGQVNIGAHSSVWFGSVLRGDINHIRIGVFTNIQDGTMVHVADSYPVEIGNYVTVGHGACIHGCTIMDNTLIGMCATILDGALVEENCIIAAAALVTEKMIAKSGMLYMGVPAKPVRRLTGEEIERNRQSAEKYMRVAEQYRNQQQ